MTQTRPFFLKGELCSSTLSIMSRETITRLIRYCLYGLIILVPLAYFPTGMYPFQVIKTVVFESLTEIIFALWLALAIFHKEFRPRRTPLSVALLALLSALSLSAIFGVDWQFSLFSDEARTLGLVALFHFAALFIVLSSLRDEIHWNTVWQVSIGTAVAASFIGILQIFLSLPKESYSEWLYILFEQPTPRIGSTFSNSAFFAGYLLFNFFIALLLSFRLWSEKKTRMVFIFLASAAVILIAIFLSQTLGVLLGLAVGLFGLAGYFFLKKSASPLFVGRISLGFLAVAIIFGAVLFATRSADVWQGVPGVGRVSTFSFEDLSVRTRLLAWRIALAAFKDKPFLGWGFENFRIAYNAHYDPAMFTLGVTGTYWDKPHNIVLEYLVTAGVIGLVGYLGIFSALFYTLWRIQKQVGLPEAAILAALALSYFIQNLVVFDTIGTYLMFFLVLAYVDSKWQIANGLPSQALRRAGTSQDSFSVSPLLSGNPSLPRVASVLLVIAVVPLYFNYQVFEASRREYWGVNYFLNNAQSDAEKSGLHLSIASFNAALAAQTPYRDDIRKNFASVVGRAYKQGIVYPRIEELQKYLVLELEAVIGNHPRDFFNYIALADFKNIFYTLDPSYPDQAELLARKAIELSPRRQQVYYTLAATRFAKGDTVGAYKTFEEVIKLNPEAGDSHFFYGLMAYGVGDAERGRAEIMRARELGRGPRTAGEAMLLGDFAADHDHDYKEAIRLYILALGEAASLHGDLKERVRLQATLKLGVASYFFGDKNQSADYFREFGKSIDFKSLPIYPQLQPVLKELDVE